MQRLRTVSAGDSVFHSIAHNPCSLRQPRPPVWKTHTPFFGVIEIVCERPYDVDLKRPIGSRCILHPQPRTITMPHSLSPFVARVSSATKGFLLCPAENLQDSWDSARVVMPLCGFHAQGKAKVTSHVHRLSPRRIET
jgi:hypothetical protein